MSNERLVELSKSLNLTCVYETNTSGEIIYCNEAENHRVYICEVDPVFKSLKDEANFALHL